jgi:predicted lipid-binding transport protein (Tim44 family)
VPVTIDKPVVPEKVEQKVKEKSNWLTWLTGILGGGGIGLGWLSGMDWQAILAGGVVLIIFLLILLLLRSQIVAAVRDIKNAVET